MEGILRLPWFLVNSLRTWYFHAIVSIQITGYEYKCLNIVFYEQDDKQFINLCSKD